MVDLNANNDIKCSACGSDFVEEMKSLQNNPVQTANSAPAQEAPSAPVRPQTAPVSPVQQL